MSRFLLSPLSFGTAASDAVRPVAPDAAAFATFAAFTASPSVSSKDSDGREVGIEFEGDADGDADADAFPRADALEDAVSSTKPEELNCASSRSATSLSASSLPASSLPASLSFPVCTKTSFKTSSPSFS